MNPEESKAMIRRCVEEAWNGRDLAQIDQRIGPNCVGHNAGGPDLQGPEGFRHFMMMYQSAFPDLRFTVEDIVVEGDKAAWRVKSSGTQNGELFGIPPTGRSGGVETMIISRFANGQWVEDWVLTDLLGLLQQLGVVPAPGAAQ